jgi:hypothetical protein
MPVSAIPIIAAVIGAFLMFILFVGGAAVWTAMPGPLHRDPEDGPIDDL